MKRLRPWVCALAFALLCGGVWAFLHAFTVSADTWTYLPWETATVTGEDARILPYDLSDYEQWPQPGALYTFTTTLEKVIPEGYLFFETAGAELALYLDGMELYRSTAILPEGATDLSQANIPLPETAVGGVLTMTCRPLTEDLPLFPPLVRMTSVFLTSRDDMAYANQYGIQAGVYAAALLLVCALFLIGLASGTPDWRLLLLIVAAACLLVYELVTSCGYYFLPKGITQLLGWEGLWFLTPLALLTYLLLNRERRFWRYLGRVTACSALVLGVCYLFSLARGSYLAWYVNDTVSALFFYGAYRGPLHWLNLWLTTACAAIAGYGLLRTMARTRAEATALAAKSEIVLESYRALEESWRQTSSLRHEIKNELTALNLLYRQGKLEALGARLAELDHQQAEVVRITFTENFAVNIILQNAAARAAEAGVRFEANALLPKELTIPESDLCTFLINLLDNALEASAQVPDPAGRFIEFKAQIKNGCLGVKCVNSYASALQADEQGRLLTTKASDGPHGLGMAQMRAVAEKYNSALVVDYTEDAFSVQTALKIPKA